MARGGKRKGAGRPRKNDQTFVYARMPQNVKEWYKRMAREHNCTIGEWLDILRQNYKELNNRGIY